MANFPGLKMTAAGRELQAKAQTGQLLKFTRVALGDGLPPADPDALVALVNECQTLSIQRQEVPGDGTAVLRVIMTNQGVTTGFYMRELATFAEDPDTGAEVLYSYSNAGDECDFLPAEGAAVVWEGIFDLVTVVGNAENVTAVIDDYITIALKSEVDALKPRLMPEGGTVGQMVRKASNAEGDVEYFDPELDGFDVRLTSIEEPRTAVANQRVFTLQKTVTNGLAVYINGERLSREAWTALSATQLQLDDPLIAGTRVLFVNNEEAGPGRALNVSLAGPSLVYPASSNNFTITDFDSFSVYTATTTVGTVTRNGAELTLDIPADAVEGTLDLEVTRDNVRATYRVAVGAAAIAAPEILSPAQGATNVTFEPDLAASAFVAYPAGYDSHAATRWQVARDTGFTDLVFDQQGADNLTAISLAAAGVRLDPATRYYVRAQYHGATLVSAWSSAVAFNTATIYIRKPTITSPLDGADRVSPGLTVTADAFSVSGGSDAHDSSRWQVSTMADFSSVIVDSGWSASHLTSFKPSGLSMSTAYFVRVKYRGAQVGESEWSSVIGFVTASQSQGVYTQLTGGATGRTNAAMAVVGRKMYVAGGQPGQNTFWEYDLDTAIWKQLPTPPWGGRYGAALAVVGSKLYLYGGYTGSYQDITYSDLWCYDTVSAVWSQLPSSVNARHGARASVIDQRIYIIGGSKGGSLNYADLQIYDIPTSKWLTGQAALQTRSYHAQGVIGGKIYIHGGRSAGNNDTTECYDPSTDQWTAKAPASLAVQLQRHGTAFAVIDEKLYVFGGYTGSYLNVYFNDLYVYDPSGDTWQALPSGATKVDGASGVSIDGKMLIFAGAISSSSYTNALWSVS